MSISMAQYDGWDEVCEDESMFERIKDSADEYATNKVRRDFEQGFQSWEMKFNSVASSRGDYPFTAITFGLGTNRWESMASSTCMKVRKGGQGKPGFKHPVLFPKLSFFYDKNIHGSGKELEWLFDEALECSMKTMYPDFISLTGDGYAPSIYKKYGVPISRMGCRAQTSPWFERGGMEPADENDKPIYEGRFNMGAISLHFSMIAAKAKKEDKDFKEVLNYYLEMARGIHRKTFEYLSHKKAATNPLGYCQGGFYGGNKNPDEELGEEFLRPMTISFGIIGLNEASVLWTGKRLDEDNSWAISILQYINDYVDKIKKEDNILYAIYGTPGESLVATQVIQFRKKYGIIKGVSDRDYMTNSFHCPVYADITPIQKQDIEYPMFHLCNGGNIGYARMRSNYNFQAFKDLTTRAMELGFYWGNNQQLNWCEKCGYAFSDSDLCPKCNSKDITRVERMNGYLGFSNVRGKTMYSDTKLQEFNDRISM
jgi:ribonucleoside-triphosphate reductase